MPQATSFPSLGRNATSTNWPDTKFGAPTHFGNIAQTLPFAPPALTGGHGVVALSNVHPFVRPTRGARAHPHKGLAPGGRRPGYKKTYKSWAPAPLLGLEWWLNALPPSLVTLRVLSWVHGGACFSSMALGHMGVVHGHGAKSILKIESKSPSQPC